MTFLLVLAGVIVIGLALTTSYYVIAARMGAVRHADHVQFLGTQLETTKADATRGWARAEHEAQRVESLSRTIDALSAQLDRMLTIEAAPVSAPAAPAPRYGPKTVAALRRETVAMQGRERRAVYARAAELVAMGQTDEQVAVAVHQGDVGLANRTIASIGIR